MKVALALAFLVVIVPGAMFAHPPLVGADEGYIVLSGSMTPTFLPGDVIFVEKIPAASYAVGDIVTFRTEPGSKTLVTHRVIAVIDHGGKVAYRTQGDANEEPDNFVVTQEMVVGKYLFHIPKWGHLKTVMSSKEGYFFIILLPGSIVILREFVRLYRELDAWDRKRQERKEGPK